MNTWKLEAGRCITTPDGTFYLAYGRTTDGSNAPLFRNFCELDHIARQVAVLPELLAALQTIVDSEPIDGDAIVCDFETLQGVARAALAKVQS